MKTAILTTVMSLMTLVSFSQDIISSNDLSNTPNKVWMSILNEYSQELFMYKDSSDEYIVNYLTEMLMEDKIEYSKPKEEILYNDGSVALVWEYTQVESNKNTFVKYLKTNKYSAITFQEEN